MSDISELEKENKRRGELLNYTFWQLNKILFSMKGAMDEEYEKINKIFDSGKVPEEKDLILRNISGQFPDLLLKLFDFSHQEFQGEESLAVMDSMLQDKKKKATKA